MYLFAFVLDEQFSGELLERLRWKQSSCMVSGISIFHSGEETAVVFSSKKKQTNMNFEWWVYFLGICIQFIAGIISCLNNFAALGVQYGDALVLEVQSTGFSLVLQRKAYCERLMETYLKREGLWTTVIEMKYID